MTHRSSYPRPTTYCGTCRRLVGLHLGPEVSIRVLNLDGPIACGAVALKVGLPCGHDKNLVTTVLKEVA